MLEIISVLIEKGIDGWEKSKEAELLRDSLRERLSREVRFNLAIWNLPATKPQPEAFAAMMSSEAFNAVCTLNLPLRLILDPNSLDAKAKQIMDEHPDGNFKNWTDGISNEVTLVERIWHRLKVLQYRQDLDGSLGNLEYLMHLHRVLHATLNQKSTESIGLR